MRPRPGDGESIGWTKLVVGGLLGAFAGLVGWVAPLLVAINPSKPHY